MLAMTLCDRGWGCFPVAVGSKRPIQARPVDDPRNETGRLDWTPLRLRRWRDARWQRPARLGGVHQAVWSVPHAEEVWGRQPMLTLVAVTRYEVMALDVDNAALADADPVIGAAVDHLTAIGAAEVDSPSGGRHYLARWPNGRPGAQCGGVADVDGEQVGDLKMGGASYTLAPGQRTDADDRWTGYWMAGGEDADTLPPVDDLPLMPAEVAALIVKARRRTARAERAAASSPREEAARPQSEGPPGSWVDRAVARDRMAGARLRRKPPDGCHEWMARAVWWAHKNGVLHGDTEARLRHWWARWGGDATREFRAEFERMMPR